jgi:hypothetical protein
LKVLLKFFYLMGACCAKVGNRNSDDKNGLKDSENVRCSPKLLKKC